MRYTDVLGTTFFRKLRQTESHLGKQTESYIEVDKIHMDWQAEDLRQTRKSTQAGRRSDRPEDRKSERWEHGKSHRQEDRMSPRTENFTSRELSSKADRKCHWGRQNGAPCWPDASYGDLIHHLDRRSCDWWTALIACPGRQLHEPSGKTVFMSVFSVLKIQLFKLHLF